ncbi:hypothetical protein NAL32_20025 [Chryseobacterium sp. Ch-15]|uniref:DinB family protein n=1 Tax=Chryseobacterium muglaense TaxID=2893752 RepID=A0A9Q3UU08_9FLAO|nr:hypothetical protein [Chryseobacterium muglaense]MBD3906909.1 hypothetical protein [Chryseobacterium muglaense]MCC9033761.1 hypothetical protein [Chryseobacterium muglaense]MCM2556685.1 hypothetical protein [Chryseobacterium muglaense]
MKTSFLRNDYLKESQNKLEIKLNSLKNLDSAIINDVSGLSFHEIYHSGQFGYLRRILGKPGAVK